jgi:hypothetical protein
MNNALACGLFDRLIGHNADLILVGHLALLLFSNSLCPLYLSIGKDTTKSYSGTNGILKAHGILQGDQRVREIDWVDVRRSSTHFEKDDSSNNDYHSLDAIANGVSDRRDSL